MVFDPSTLAGKVLWLRAKDNGVANSSVATWVDQSGKGNDLGNVTIGTAPTVADASTPLGGKSVTFAANSSYDTHLLGVTKQRATASSYYINNVAYSPLQVLDANTSTAWVVHNAQFPAWITLSVVSAYAETSYRMTPRTGLDAQAPRSWTVKGSNDNATWTLLDTRTDVPFTGGQTFTFTNTTAYSHYKFDIASSWAGGDLGLSELALLNQPAFTAPAAGEAWFVVKATGGSLMHFGTSGLASYYFYSNGATVYDDFASTSRQSFAPSLAVSSWRIYRVKSDGVWQSWLDGVLQKTATVPVGWDRISSIASGKPSGDSKLTGNIAEVLVRSQVSTAQEVSDITAYLTAEHFVAPVTTQPSGSAPVSVGSSSVASSITTATGSAPISAGSSSEASIVATVTAITTGAAPVGAESSSEASILSGGAVASTTGSAPALVGSSSSASVVGIQALVGWTADESRKTYLDIGSDIVELDYAPPFAEGDPVYGLPPVDTIALPPVVILPGFPQIIVERRIKRESVTVPAMAPGPDGKVRIADDVYAAYPTVREDVGVPHVLIGGIDCTYLRGAPIGGTDRQEAPFGDVSAMVNFPQITAQDNPGAGALSWLKPEASFERVMACPDGTIKRLWSGHLVSDTGGLDAVAARTSWTASGALWQASTFGHRVPTIMDPTDISTVISRALNRVISRRYPAIPVVTTGIKTTDRGASSDSELGYVGGLLAKAWTAAGRQWTVLKKVGTRRTYALTLKDMTTVHHTVTVGQRGVDINISRDMTSTVNAIYGRGIAPNGYGWANWCYPYYHPDASPAYPFTNPANVITVGATDAGTDSGNGVSRWQQRANDLNLTPNVKVDGVFNSSDSAVCRDIQEANGLLVDGVLGPQTWAGTFAVGSDSGSLDGAYRRPLAIHTTTEPFTYSASGAVTGDNPGYTGAMRWELDLDFGTGITRAQAIASAKLQLARDRLPGLVGTITLLADPREGSRFFIAPGQNIKVIGYNGRDVLLHVSAVDRNWDTLSVTLTVDEKARDAMTVAAILARDKAAKIDPARRPGHSPRRSRLEQDLTVEFDGEAAGGVIPKFALYGGLWSVVPIPVSQVGSIAKIELRTSGPASKFAFALFSGEVTPAHLEYLVGDPLAGDSPFARTDAKGDALDDLGLINAWGQSGSACGYGLRDEATGSLTGRFVNTSPQSYSSAKPPWVWFAVRATTSCYISGRIYPQVVQ